MLPSNDLYLFLYSLVATLGQAIADRITQPGGLCLVSVKTRPCLNFDPPPGASRVDFSVATGAVATCHPWRRRTVPIFPRNPFDPPHSVRHGVNARVALTVSVPWQHSHALSSYIGIEQTSHQ